MKDYAASQRQKLIKNAHQELERELRGRFLDLMITNFRRFRRGNGRMALLSMRDWVSDKVNLR